MPHRSWIPELCRRAEERPGAVPAARWRSRLRLSGRTVRFLEPRRSSSIGRGRHLTCTSPSSVCRRSRSGGPAPLPPILLSRPAVCRKRASRRSVPLVRRHGPGAKRLAQRCLSRERVRRALSGPALLTGGVSPILRTSESRPGTMTSPTSRAAGLPAPAPRALCLPPATCRVPPATRSDGSSGQLVPRRPPILAWVPRRHGDSPRAWPRARRPARRRPPIVLDASSRRVVPVGTAPSAAWAARRDRQAPSVPHCRAARPRRHSPV